MPSEQYTQDSKMVRLVPAMDNWSTHVLSTSETRNGHEKKFLVLLTTERSSRWARFSFCTLAQVVCPNGPRPMHTVCPVQASIYTQGPHNQWARGCLHTCLHKPKQKNTSICWCLAPCKQAQFPFIWCVCGMAVSSKDGDLRCFHLYSWAHTSLYK